MRVVKLTIASLEDVKDRALKAFKGEYQGHFITFPDFELLCKLLSPERMKIIKALIGSEPMELKDIAQRMNRRVSDVNQDIKTLIHAGLLEIETGGKILFRYDAIHVDFMIDNQQE